MRLHSLDGDGEHAVHDEDDEHVVPHHHVPVEVHRRPLRQHHVEGTPWKRRGKVESLGMHPS